MVQEFHMEVREQREDAVRFHIKKGERKLSFKEVFTLWGCDSEFVEFYTNELIGFGYEAFYWEHPAIQKAFLHRNYECTLHRSTALELSPINEHAFKDRIASKSQVVDFMNIGKDARLVVPTKQTDEEIYNHLGKFIRLATHTQIIETFKCVGVVILEEIEQQKLIWLNTAGLGVVWLHIRMDTQPKYYNTQIYREPDYLQEG